VKLGRSDVLVGAQVVLDGGEVHRLFNDLGVVRNAQRDGVDGLIILLINCILNLLIEFIIRTLVAACVGLGGCQRLGLVLRGK
jgi:hypothetical protein